MRIIQRCLQFHVSASFTENSRGWVLTSRSEMDSQSNKVSLFYKL
ncbi:hypothetical protein HMPREF1986_01892 [Oribacterium sp. oral taxon 078 str. F0263]|nr:hypothetical protein HMPREF1986_01892 [Oribacterium sp. oral taxon 078 str. F0263]